MDICATFATKDNIWGIKMQKIDKRFLGVGVALGAGLGVAMGNLAICLSLGVIFGIVVGRLKAKRDS